MVDSTNQNASGADTNSSGKGDENQHTDENQNDSSGKDAGKNNQVAYDTYKKVVGERRSLSERLKVAEGELESQKAAKKKAEEDKLVKDKHWEKLAETKDTELKVVKAENLELKTTLADGAKMDAFLTKIRSSHGDVERQYWGLVDVDKIKIDSETQLPEPESVAEVVNIFAESYAKVLISKSSSQAFNGQGGRGKGALTHEEWKKLPLKEMKKRVGEVKL